MQVKYRVMNDTDHRSRSDHDAPARKQEEPSHQNPPTDEKTDPPREIGGRKGPDPVRYGDWEKNGRCIDF
ncbi:MAG: DUF1674 domain-containing protein [Pseudomonadota bacterium]